MLLIGSRVGTDPKGYRRKPNQERIEPNRPFVINPRQIPAILNTQSTPQQVSENLRNERPKINFNAEVSDVTALKEQEEENRVAPPISPSQLKTKLPQRQQFLRPPTQKERASLDLDVPLPVIGDFPVSRENRKGSTNLTKGNLERERYERVLVGIKNELQGHSQDSFLSGLGKSITQIPDRIAGTAVRQIKRKLNPNEDYIEQDRQKLVRLNEYEKFVRNTMVGAQARYKENPQEWSRVIGEANNTLQEIGRQKDRIKKSRKQYIL